MRFFAAAAALAVACAACGRGPAQAPRPAPKPDILLITIDTWRADRFRRDLTPTLAAVADRGAVFTNARAAVPLTLPSHTTMLTGLLPPGHGVRENGQVLGDSRPTVATILKAGGYRTAAFIGAFVLDRRFGLARGFDVYDDRIPRDPNATEKLDAERPASAVVDAALRWLDQPGPRDSRDPRDPRDPFFLWIHVYDPHAPYKGSYDAEIASADAQLKRLLDRLNLDTTAIVVAGDHGEGLGEHGERTHGMLLYDSTLRVPLFIAGAGIMPAKRAEPIGLVDVAPTILALAGVAPPTEMVGEDLLGGRDARGGTGGKGGRTVTDAPDIYAETEYPRVAGWSPLQALTDGRWKTIRAGKDSELYDLQNDPRESKNLAVTQQSTASAMRSRINAIRARGGAASTTVSAEAAERLRALGYVASSVQLPAAEAGPNPAQHIDEWNTFEEALSARAGSVVSTFKRLAEKNPDAQVFQASYAKALRDTGNTNEALARYRAAARRWPTDAALLHDLATAARDAGHLDEAIKADQAALALQPSSAMARNGLGLIAVDRGRPQDAVPEFAAATQLDPNNASYWVNLGNAKHASGDRPGAEQAYKQALDVDAHAADAANGLGVLLVEAKQPSAAVAWFDRALSAQPAFAEAQLNRGIALQQAGDLKRAADAYRAVLANAAAQARERAAARSLLASVGEMR